MVPPKTSMESKGARQSCSAFTDAAVCLYAHAHTLAYTHSHMFLPIDHYQLVFPSGPGKVARSLRCSEAGISTEVSQTHAHTDTYTANLVKVGLHMYILSPPSCINHCPPSNEGERTDSLKHLIPPPKEPSEGLRARGREKNWDSGNGIERKRGTD